MHDLTPAGAIAAGALDHGDPVTLTGRATDFDLARTVTSDPSGTFMLEDGCTAVRVHMDRDLFASTRHILGPMCIPGGAQVCMPVTVHGTAFRSVLHHTLGVHAHTIVRAHLDDIPCMHIPDRVRDDVHTAIHAGQPVDLPARIRVSAIGFFRDRARARPPKPGTRTFMPAIVQDVHVHDDPGGASATCTLVGVEDGATAAMLVPASVYRACGERLALGAAIVVHARVAEGREWYLVAINVTPNDDRPGTLLRVPLPPPEGPAR
jgi:hypothetical protein